MMRLLLNCLLVLSLGISAPSLAQPTTIIRDTTLIDGTGAPARNGVDVLVQSGRIAEISDERIEAADAVTIDGKGKFLMPGIIDSNVHASVYGNSKRRETAVKYGERNPELIEEFLQRQLKYGVTTVRDSYGSLPALTQVRDAVERGEVVGSRLLVAGNILGWGGPFSLTFSLMQESDLTLFQERWNDLLAQGAGEELMDMGPEELAEAVDRYLDKGANFIKYGGTSHFRYPSLIGFSPRQQAVIVERTHARGLIAETHATSSESLRMAVEAGIDHIQHPEILSRDYPQDLIDLIVERNVLCGLRSNTLTGEPWAAHQRSRKAALAAQKDLPPPATTAEQRRRDDQIGESYERQRRNAERLIKAGCRVTIATDNYQGRAPEFRRDVKPVIQEAGIGSLLAVEGLVELGMSEMEALVASTRNGAITAGALDDYGTIEVGKSADMLLLSANPLKNIRNIRQQEMVMLRGQVIDTDALPRQRIFYTGD